MSHASPFSKIDQPEALRVLFHPRRDSGSHSPPGAVDYRVQVDEGVGIVCRIHLAGIDCPNIIFFHGNGEIVSDYDPIGPMFTKAGMNLLAADYRGYGKSSGNPTVSTMLPDARVIFTELKEWLAQGGYSGPLVVMGRSLGCVSALEIAAAFPDDFACLVIESGFATTMPLLLSLGVDVHRLGINEADGFNNIQKIAGFTKPTFLLHASKDQIIPLSQATILHSHCGAKSKELQVVPGADHNTIIQITGKLYFDAIRKFIDKATGVRPKRWQKNR